MAGKKKARRRKPLPKAETTQLGTAKTLVVLRDRASGRLDPRLTALLSLDPAVTEPCRSFKSQLLCSLEGKVESPESKKYYSPPLHGLDLSDATAPKADVLIKFRKDPASVQIDGLTLQAAGKRIATATVSLDVLRMMEHHPDVEFIELSRVVHPCLDRSAAIVRADQMWARLPAIKGKGVVIGIVDAGFDFHHKDFRDPVTDRTRIRFFWDQSATAGGAPPVGFLYGVEYTRQQIDQDLSPGPAYSVVQHQAEADAHGTLVAGVAAGNAREDPRYCGIAPESELILVNTTPSNELAFGSQKRIADAIEYVFRRAAGTPCVLNLSVGDNLGPHDGTSLVEQKIDEVLTGTAGRAVVIAAGNANQKGKHCAANFGPGSQTTLLMHVPIGTQIPESMEIWYPADALFRLTIVLPNAQQAGPYQGDGPALLDSRQDVDIQVAPTIRDGRNGQNVISVVLYPKANNALPDGPWSFILDEVSGTPWASATLDLRASIDQNTEIRWTNHPSPRTLITPGTCREGITVGSHERQDLGNVDGDSGCGPTHDDRQKPDIVAPGVGIWTTRAGATPASPARYVKKVGTSLAAPHVAGAIALLLSNQPGLTNAQIKGILQLNADPSGPPAAKAAAYGWGRLRIA